MVSENSVQPRRCLEAQPVQLAGLRHGVANLGLEVEGSIRQELLYDDRYVTTYSCLMKSCHYATSPCCVISLSEVEGDTQHMLFHTQCAANVRGEFIQGI